MSDFHDWEGVLSTPGFRKALLAYGRANGEIKPKRAEYGVRPLPVIGRS